MASENSLGDQSTFGGADSSIGDFGESGHEHPEFELTDLTGRYSIERSLGKGGMGEVLLAVDNRLKRKVAIKRVLAPGRAALSRFLAEAQALASLNHFNIVQVYDYGRDSTGPYLIMEYVEGESLQERLKAGPMKPAEAIEIACKLCDGLSKAHGAAIVHRDIKPANILLTVEGEPKLTDFGLAKQEATDHGRTIAGTVLGTLDYMPPEQRRDALRVDARSDLWSLAATLYAMLTGSSPRVIRIDRLPASLQKVVGKGLEDDPSERFASASEFRTALREVTRVPASEPSSGRRLSGECPNCRHRNSDESKFCASCAAKLTCSCLSCGMEIKVWSDICTQCGTRQSTVVTRVLQEGTARLDEATSNLNSRNLPQAISILRALKVPSDPRFAHLQQKKILIQQQAQSLQSEFQSLQERILTQFQGLKDEGRWSEIKRMISALPNAVRRPEIVEANAEVEHVLRELADLTARIRVATSARDYGELLQTLPRYLELEPGNEVARRLLVQTLTRQSAHEPPPVSDFTPAPVESVLSTAPTIMYMKSGLVSDQEMGPVSPSLMAVMLAGRKVSTDTLARAVDENTWRPLRTFNGIVSEAKAIRLRAQQNKRASRAKAVTVRQNLKGLTSGPLDLRISEHITLMNNWFIVDVKTAKATMFAIAGQAKVDEHSLKEIATITGGMNQRMFTSMVVASSLFRLLPALFVKLERIRLDKEQVSREGQIAGAVLTAFNPLLGLGLVAASSLGKPQIELTEEVRWPLARQIASALWRLESAIQPLVPGGMDYDLGQLTGLVSFGKLLLTNDVPFGCMRPESWFLEEFAVSAALLNAKRMTSSTEYAAELLERHIALQTKLLDETLPYSAEHHQVFSRAFGESASRMRQRLRS